MSIPVYGLSGLEALGDVQGRRHGKPYGASFDMYASRIKDPVRRAAVIDGHLSVLRGIEGIYNLSNKKIKDGTATPEDRANARKAKVLLVLDDTDYDAFRLASRLMPYCRDIDERDGGWYFDSQEIADLAAKAEEEYLKLLKTSHGEVALDGWNPLKKIKNAAKKVVNAVVDVAKSVGGSVADATKATLNTVKATGQLVTGNVSGAKETIKKAGNQIKNATVDPLKAAYEAQKDIVNTGVDLAKEVVKIAGKVFKVLFIKINPVTVLIRNSLRALIGLNLAGMATRLNVGLMTQAEAEGRGYSKETWEKAVKAVNRTKKLFKNMGGNVSKLEKSIQKGAKNPPLQNDKIDAATKINIPDNNDDDGDATLGWVEIAAAIASCLGILVTIWQWIASIVAQKKATKEAKEQQQKIDEENARQQKAWQEQYEKELEIYAHDENGNFYMDENGNRYTWDDYNKLMKQGGDNGKRNLLIAAAVGALLIGGAVIMSKKK